MKENIQIQINKLKELVHNTVLAKPADFALNFYSVLTAINGLLSIQGSLVEKRLLLNDLEQGSKQYEEVSLQYNGLKREYFSQQVVLSTAIYDFAKTMQDPSLKDLGTLMPRIIANMLILKEREERPINGIVGESAHFDISLTFAIVADIALASNRLIESANQKISNKIPKGISFLGKFLGKFGDILTFVANNLVDEHGNSKAVLYRFNDEHPKEKHLELALINDRLGDILRNEFHQSNLIVRLIEGLGESLEEFVVELASAWLPDGVNPWLETNKEEGTYFIGDQKENKNDKAYGTKFEDYLIGFSGDDYLSALEGNDYLNGGLGNDTLNGGEGNDTLIDEAGNETYDFIGDFGHDTIYDQDGQGVIKINYQSLSAGKKLQDDIWQSSHPDYMIRVAKTQENVEGYYSLHITSKSDKSKSITIPQWKQGDLGLNLTGLGEKEEQPTNTGYTLGTDDNNIIDGYSHVAGYAGNDLILTTLNNDVVIAGIGHDVIGTGAGDDVIYAGVNAGAADDDVVFAGEGSDKIYTGAGDDIIFSSSNLNGYFRYIIDDLKTEEQQEADDKAKLLPYHRSYSNIFLKEIFYDSIAYTSHSPSYYMWETHHFLPSVSSYYLATANKNERVDFFYNVYAITNNGEGYKGADIVYAGAGHDVLVGSSEHDSLYGEQGNDALYGLHGDDILDGGDGDDDLIGGYGLDVLVGGSGKDRLIGGIDHDKLYGGEGDDLLDGDMLKLRTINDYPKDTPLERFGHDYLDGGQGNDYLYGNGGNDRLVGGEGHDTLLGDERGLDGKYHGDDILDGGDGDDKLLGGGKDDVLYGGAGDDVLHGDDEQIEREHHGHDILDGGDGNDKLIGDGGNDTLYGGAGDDELQGDARDLEHQSHGHDILDGGEGNDIIIGYGGDDSLYGGADDDELQGDANQSVLEGNYHGRDLLEGGAGNDKLFGYGGDDRLYGGIGNDHLQGDAMDLDGEHHGHDVLDGGQGNDVLLGEGGHDILYGGEGDDVLLGDAKHVDAQYHGDDKLYGGAGDDSLQGFDGRDELDGGSGRNWISGGRGADILMSHTAHHDDLFGGEGDDNYHITLREAHINITDGEGTNHVYLEQKFDIENARIIANSNGIKAIQFTQALNTEETQQYFSLRFFGDEYVSTSSGESIMDEYGQPLRGGYNFYLHFKDSAGQAQSIHIESYANMSVGLNFMWFTGVIKGIWGNYRLLDNMVYHEHQQSLDYHASLLSDEVNIQTILDNAEQHDILKSDRYYMGAGHDIVQGSAQNDVMYGEHGNDTLYGHAGDDTLYGGEGHDILEGGEGHDMLNGGDGNDILNAGTGNNVLNGGIGNDTLTVGEGGSSLDGGVGDDVFYIQAGSHRVIGGQGQDVIHISEGQISYQLRVGDGIDRIIHLNHSQLSLQFLDVDINQVSYYIADNGKDIIVQYSENDQLILENAKENFPISHIDFADGLRLDALQIKAQIQEHIHGTDGNDNIQLHGYTSFVQSGLGHDILHGSTGQDHLHGGEDNDQLYGYYGNDHLHGGDGNDHLEGGHGDDIYHFQPDWGQDVIRDDTGQNQIYFHQLSASSLVLSRKEHDLIIKQSDSEHMITVINHFRVDAQPVMTAIHFDDGTQWTVEDIRKQTMIGTARDDVIHGLASDDQLFGLQGADQLFGGEGHDTLYGGDGNDTLHGEQGNDHLIGGVGNDILEGGAGTDRLEGGAGDDTYIIHDIHDTIIEKHDEGIDHVISHIDLTLAEHIEHLTLADTSYLTVARTAIGNRLNNTLTGNYLDNVLDGKDGADILIGGLGNDTYYVEHSEDVIREHLYEGLDTVFASVDYILPEHVENLYLTEEALSAIGNDLNNELRGNAQNNRLLGGLGNDILDGGFGADILVGGQGDDTYYVDNQKDSVNESLNQGVDSVFSRIDYILPEHVEYLYLQEHAISGIGNALDNTIVGNAENNILDGKQGADRLMGGLGNDYYVLDHEQDEIVEHAGEGIDSVEQWVDRPFYRTDDTGQRIKTTSYQMLQNHVENLILKGTATTVFGNDLDNHITLNEQNNFVNALTGNDVIVYQKGGGHDRISSKDDISAKDTLLIQGYDASQATFVRMSNSATGHDMLQIRFKGNPSDQITLIDYFAPTTNGQDYRIDEIRFVHNNQSTVLSQAQWESQVISQALNHAPTVNKHPKAITANVGKTLSVTFDADTIKDIDAYDSSLSYRMTLATRNAQGQYEALPSWLSFDAKTLTLTTTPTHTHLGQYQLILWGTDHFGLSAGTYVNINVQKAVESSQPSTPQNPTTPVVVDSSTNTNKVIKLQQKNNLLGKTSHDTLSGTEHHDRLQGFAGNDTLHGKAGNDVLIGGVGQDTLIGGAGNDLYYFSKGFGRDAIVNTGGGIDNVYFEGITTQQVKSGFGKVNNDLTLKVSGTTDQLTVKNFFLGGEYANLQFNFADNLHFSSQSILQAFKSKSTPSHSQSSDYYQALQHSLALKQGFEQFDKDKYLVEVNVPII